jgi:plastocyanin
MDTEERETGELDVGDLVVVDGEICRVTNTESSAGGKHGTAKVTVAAESLGGEEHSLTQPEDAAVEVPVFEATSNPLVLVGGEDHFDPLGVRVAPGSNVVWLFDDDDPHQVVVGDAFESDREAGEGFTAEYTFEEAGVYPYRCTVHGAAGVVVVAD